MTMMKAVFLLSTIGITVDAATKVAVLEFGNGGVVRRTTSKQTDTSVAGVASFWGALHGRELQQAGMPLVPDLFNKPDRVVILGMTGVDFDTMPTLSNLVENKSVGHMEVKGFHCKNLLNKVGPSKLTSAKDFIVDAKMKLSETGLNSLTLQVTDSNSAVVEAQLGALLSAFEDQAKDGKTIVLHLVVEEGEEAAHRRLESRDLANADDQNANGNGQNGFYGYGYYDNYGKWITPYKTMFQIQYFNVVLWTSIILVFVLFFTVSLMINMPLEADTLLFGESAKMVGE